MSSGNDPYKSLRGKIVQWLASEAGRKFRWAERLLVAPDLGHLFLRLLLAPEVPTVEKAKLVGLIVYVASPVDILPEALLGLLGYAEDVALASYVLNSIVSKTPEGVIRGHWAGDPEVLQTLQRGLRSADEMVGSGLWRKIRKLVGR